MPVLTRRTVVERLNLERLRAHAIEAAEQCERTALARAGRAGEARRAAQGLAGGPRALSSPTRRGGEPLSRRAPGPAAILIGPEGGFTDEERAAIRALPQARPVSLGPRILRADTAALAAVALWMAAAGDWSRMPE